MGSPVADRLAEQILHRYLADLRRRQETDDPDVVAEARELEGVAWAALQLVWAERW